jgi:hypothetical protein
MSGLVPNYEPFTALPVRDSGLRARREPPHASASFVAEGRRARRQEPVMLVPRDTGMCGIDAVLIEATWRCLRLVAGAAC